MKIIHYQLGDDFYMKKLLIVIVVCFCFYLFTNVHAESLMIPEEAIRMRVLANSNSDYDQTIKKEVSLELQKSMYHLLKNTKGVEQARKVITNNMDEIEASVKATLVRLDYDAGYQINYGMNYFPNKEFHGVTYEEGYYESVLVTLGSGEGDNWWCVLFPPLCLLEAEESDQVEYQFYVKELIDQYL